VNAFNAKTEYDLRVTQIWI